MHTDHRHNQDDLHKKNACRLLVITALILIMSMVALPLLAQKPNGSELKKHSPQRASIYSAVLPGLGQAYNQKYWKIPIVYAGFGALGYNIYFNNVEYQKLKEAYLYVINKDTFPINNDYVARYNAQQLQIGRDYYRRNLELGYILTGVWYILNIIDATVDAHFLNYDVGENLSLKLEPVFLSKPEKALPIAGLSLSIRF